jgi:hypothetical protein
MELEHSHNVRMHQATAYAPLPVEPIPRCRVRSMVPDKKLERDDALRLPVACQPYLCHPATTEATQQSIAVTQPRTFTQYPHTLS